MTSRSPRAGRGRASVWCPSVPLVRYRQAQTHHPLQDRIPIRRLALAALLATLAADVADAGTITLQTAPFTGTEFDYTSVTGFHPLPYTDSNGTVVSTTNSGFVSGTLDVYASNPAATTTLNLTWTLASGTSTTDAGVEFDMTNSGFSFTSATFTLVGGGTDTYNSSSPSITSSFVGFSDTSAFKAVTYNFTTTTYASSVVVDYFTFSPATVPEPASLINLGLAGLGGLGALCYRRRKATLA